MPSPDDRNSRNITWWPVWVAYLVLLAVGVPWYWPEGDTTQWFGMPAWVVTAIACSLAVSLLTAAVLTRPWPEEESAAENDSKDQEPAP